MTAYATSGRSRRIIRRVAGTSLRRPFGLSLGPTGFLRRGLLIDVHAHLSAYLAFLLNDFSRFRVVLRDAEVHIFRKILE